MKIQYLNAVTLSLISAAGRSAFALSNVSARKIITLSTLYANNNEYDDETSRPKLELRAPRLISYGLQNRSPPSTRKALGSGSKTHATVYVCENCGAEEVQWVGRCPTCKVWNSVQKHKVPRDGSGISKRVIRSDALKMPASGWLPQGTEGYGVATRLTDITSDEAQRRISLPNAAELSRVLGGGLVPGSMVMIGGDPGVGKSTLLLQLAGSLAGESSGKTVSGESLEVNSEAIDSTCHVVYISGEESVSQIASRAQRLGLQSPELFLMAETDIEVICYNLELMQPTPTLVVIDSIQTMRSSNLPSAPGSITQVRDCASCFLRLAKSTGISVVIIGHVTKSGDIAGPKTVEHMVDTVLYLEGDLLNSYRLLRSVKNRFGSCHEIGVFEMTSMGLEEVANPSLLFTSTTFGPNNEGSTRQNPDGTAVMVAMEGTRPLLCEIQALVISSSNMVAPKRAAEGIGLQRLQLLLAVIQKRLKYPLSSKEVYVNIVGGLRLQETASDLAIALSVLSSLTNIPVRSDTAFIGEIGLGGELRMVQQVNRRISEAMKYGFKRVIIPMGRGVDRISKYGKSEYSSIEVLPVETLREAMELGLETSPPPPSTYRRRRLPRQDINTVAVNENFTDGDNDTDENEYYNEIQKEMQAKSVRSFRNKVYGKQYIPSGAGRMGHEPPSSGLRGLSDTY